MPTSIGSVTRLRKLRPTELTPGLTRNSPAGAVTSCNVIAHSADPRSGRGNNMRAETPEVIRDLERRRYHSEEWSRDAGIRQRGLGVRIVADPNVSKQKQDRLPEPGK